MHTTTRYQGSRSFTSIAADKPMQTVPEIKREFTDDGVRMYETTEGKLYRADLYDLNFKVTRGKIKTPQQSKFIPQRMGR